VKLSRYTPWRRMGERRYSSCSYLTSALDGGEWSASRPGRALPPGKEPSVPIVQETGWAPEPVWTQRLEERSSASVGDRTPAVQSVVRHYTDWATAALLITLIQKERIHMLLQQIILRSVQMNSCITVWFQRLLVPVCKSDLWRVSFISGKRLECSGWLRTLTPER
jgi:hypothetical protein